MIIPIFALILGLEFPAVVPEMFGTQSVAFVTFEGTLRFAKMIDVGGSVKTWILPVWDGGPLGGLNPVYADFLFFVRIRWKFLELNYEHDCLHNFGGWYWPQKEGDGVNRIYLKISLQGG